MTMYAKNLPVPPKFDFPYQQQQRYSGSLVTPTAPKPAQPLSRDTLSQVEETAKKLHAAKS